MGDRWRGDGLHKVVQCDSGGEAQLKTTLFDDSVRIYEMIKDRKVLCIISVLLWSKPKVPKLGTLL